MKSLNKPHYSAANQGKLSEKEFSNAMISSVLGILLCIVCLAGTTWAWYTAKVVANVADVEAAVYDVTVEVDGTGLTANNGIYTLAAQAGVTHNVTLEAVGSASIGYCVITLPGGVEYYAPSLATGTGITFSILLEEAGDVTFRPGWGTYTGTTGIIITAGAVIPAPITP